MQCAFVDITRSTRRNSGKDCRGGESGHGSCTSGNGVWDAREVANAVLCIPNAYPPILMHRMHGQLIYGRNKPSAFSINRKPHNAEREPLDLLCRNRARVPEQYKNCFQRVFIRESRRGEIYRRYHRPMRHRGFVSRARARARLAPFQSDKR